MKMVDWDHRTEVDHRSWETVNLHHEYEYKLRTYVRFLYKMEDLRENARVQRVVLENGIEGHSPLRLISILDEMLAVEIELLDLRQQLYIKLLQLYRTSQHANFLECLQLEDLSHIGKKLLGERFFLLHTDRESLADAAFLKAFLVKNEMQQVLLVGPVASVKAWREKFAEEPGTWRLYLEKDRRETPDMDAKVGYFTADNSYKIIWVHKNNGDPSWHKVSYVPVADFPSRLSLEDWITHQVRQSGRDRFVLSDFARLQKLDERILDELTR